jgi:hypothetical protein
MNGGGVRDIADVGKGGDLDRLRFVGLSVDGLRVVGVVW